MEETLTIHIAKRTMQLKERNSCVSFISTIWRDQPTMIMFNNLNNKIMDTYFYPTYQEGDMETLEYLISDFLN